MALIPEPADGTVKRIYESYEKREKQHFSRRLGASQIGRPCGREKWYSFRWAKAQHWEGRMLRLFLKGHLEEPIVGSDLKQIGVDWQPVDPETGEQWEFSELGDHFVCKLDGAACGFVESPATWHVVEIKTSSEQAFNKVCREGCAKAKPEHMAQMVTGMGLSGMERAMYIVVNKNTDEIYTERIHYNAKDWKRILQQAKEIIFAVEPPERINESPAHWQCKFCNFASICHDMGGIAEVNCRTCQFSTPLEEGGWVCEAHRTSISYEEQMAGCDDHVRRPGMVCATASKALDMFNGKLTTPVEDCNV